MSPTKNLYISEADIPIWERAEQAAKDRRESVSKIVATALRAHLPKDIRVIVKPHEPVTFDDKSTPILEYDNHAGYGPAWALWYRAPGRPSDTEIHVLAGDRDHPPLDQARQHLRFVHGGVEDITVAIGEQNIPITFVGRWLVEPDSEETRTREPEFDAGMYWGVALTRKGRIAVYTAHCNERQPATLDDYDTITDAAQHLPDDILSQASQALGIQRAIRRDI